MSHLGMMAVFAACVAVVFGALLRDDPRSQFQFALRLFGGLLLGAYVAGWLMYAVFR